MQNICTKEKYKKVNETTKAIISDYLSECRSKNLTTKTIKVYKYNLRYTSLIIYERFENKSILEMTKKNFRDLQLILQDEFELSNSRINAVFGPISSCLDYAEDDDETWINYTKNPLKKTKRLPRKPTKDKIFLSRKEVRKIIDTLLSHWKIQEAVMVSIAFDTGARVSELVQIKKEGILNGNVTNEVLRKGEKKKSKLMFLNDTKLLIGKWLEMRGDDDIDELFITPSMPNPKKKQSRKAISIDTFSYRIKNSGKIIDKTISPHVFRRSRAETLKRGEDERFDGKKFNAREIQILLGHNNLATTQFYLKDDTEEIFNKLLNFMI